MDRIANYPNARDLLDSLRPVSLDAEPAGLPPKFSGHLVNKLLDQDARAEAEYLAARTARRAALAGLLGVKPEYAASRDREKLREDFAAAHAVRYAVARGHASGWDPAYQKIFLAGAFGWKPASNFHWYRAKKKS